MTICAKECVFILQWHITDRCNLRCKHCYQDNEDSSCVERGYEDGLALLKDYANFLAVFRNKNSNGNVKGLVTITGGEPLLVPWFYDMCWKVKEIGFELAVLTNGTLINVTVATRLREFEPKFVQVSIDGRQSIHDEIRGTGSFKRAIDGLQLLVATGVNISISFTAHKGNYEEFYEVAKLGADIGVSSVWSDRLIPAGNGAEMASLVMGLEETKEYCKVLKKAREDFKGRTKVKMHRAMQFLVSGGEPYRCSAGNWLLTVMPNGDVFPCRRMPISVGNVRDSRLRDLYYENPVLQLLRDESRIPKDCVGCGYLSQCRGGLRCLGYAVSGGVFEKDRGCWL